MTPVHVVQYVPSRWIVNRKGFAQFELVQFAAVRAGQFHNVFKKAPAAAVIYIKSRVDWFLCMRAQEHERNHGLVQQHLPWQLMSRYEFA